MTSPTKRKDSGLVIFVPPSPTKKFKGSEEMETNATQTSRFLRQQRYHLIFTNTSLPESLINLVLSFFSFNDVKNPQEKRLFTLLQHTDILLSRVTLVAFKQVSCFTFYHSNNILKKPLNILTPEDLQVLQTTLKSTSSSRGECLTFSEKAELLRALDEQLNLKTSFKWRELRSYVEIYQLLTNNPHFSFSNLKEKIEASSELTFDFSESEISDKELRSIMVIFQGHRLVALFLNRTPITNISSFSLPGSLQHLELDFCFQLENIQPLVSLKNLKHLSLRSCHKLNIKQVSLLTSLTHLDLSNWNTFDTIDALAPLKLLENLILNSCQHLSNINAVRSFTSLSHLSLFCCINITDIRATASLRFLQSLDLSGCVGLLEIVFSSTTFVSLRSLKLKGCSQLTDKIKSIGSLPSLMHLNLSGFGFFDISFLTPLKSLESLTLKSCLNLNNISAISSLTSLKILDVSECKQLVDISSFAFLTFLQDLCLEYSENVTNLKSLTSLTNLKKLNLNNLTNLTDEDILPLNFIKSLEELSLAWCVNLTNIEIFYPMKSLKILQLTYCYNLGNIFPLYQHLPQCQIS